MFRRLFLLFSLILVALLAAYFWIQQPLHEPQSGSVSVDYTPQQTLSVRVINRILAPYNIRVLNLDTESINLNQLHIPRLVLQFQHNYIAVEELNIRLNQGLSMLLSASFELDKIQSISAKRIYVHVNDPSIKQKAEQQNVSDVSKQNTDYAFDLTQLEKLPALSIDELSLNFAKISDSQHNQPFNIALTNLHSDEHQLAATASINHHQLISLTARHSLSDSAGNRQNSISASYHLEVSQTIAALEQLQRYLLDYAKAKLAQGYEVNRIYESILEALIPLHQMSQMRASLHGTLQGQALLNPQSGLVNTKHTLDNASISFNDNVWLKPHTSMQLMSEHQINMLRPLVIQGISPKHSFSLAPFELEPNNELLIANQGFWKLLALPHEVKTYLHATLKQLPDAKFAGHTPLKFEFNHDTANLYLQQDKASLSLCNDDESLRLVLKSLTFNSLTSNSLAMSQGNETDMSANFSLTGSLKRLAPNTDSHTYPLSDLLSQALQSSHLSINQPEFNIDGSLRLNHSQNIELALDPGSEIKLSAATFNSEVLSGVIGATKFTVIDPASLRFKGSLAESDIDFGNWLLDINSLSIARDTSLSEISYYKVDNIALSQTSPRAGIKLEEDQTTLSSQLSWQFTGLALDRKARSGKNYRLIALDKLSIAQGINLTRGLWSTHESWQLGALKPQSKHWVNLNKNPTFAGQWQLDSSAIDTIDSLRLNTLAQPYELTGDYGIKANFALTQYPHQNSFELKLQQHVNQVSALVSDNRINNGQLQLDCQFDWVSSTQMQSNTQSQLHCPKALLSVKQLHSSLKFENVQIGADILLNRDSQTEPNNWLQRLTGLSQSDVKLSARGKVLDGRFIIPQAVIKLHDESNGYILVQGVSADALLKQQPISNLNISGIFDGVLPAKLDKGKLTISGGNLAARQPGGLIELQQNEAITELVRTQPQLETAVQALAHLNYHHLAGTFDMQDTGDAKLSVSVQGKAKNYSRPVHLNYQHQENLYSLYQSLQIPYLLEQQIETNLTSSAANIER
ncbi:hypothetical protein EXU30_18995 [Shewanella maritima]|uniref:Uncharacterized protein n=1 Tax=Shewanella maritima TaxID=2520507 RepID=A0A411PLX8_9GAMM|nr:YdbH domain-containing protein [Shewanella maritima]QBF84519.1 hypothetical protein EXU30_18995 [Shewanella maritima]